ncbi:MAG: methionyl-tRNA formyltransferase, partial [Pseudobutyrivibrio sp.]|nr:methionyl-tRNA formyltransferase [Pseudobutyrivibrio sp.]
MKKTLFIGCVESSYVLLEAMFEAGYPVAGIVTMEQSAINADFKSLVPLAEKYNVPYICTKNVNDDETVGFIKNIAPEVIYCFGWSRLIGSEILALPKYGVVGFHPAALPCNKGRHPLIWALVLGLKETASTFFIMDEGADTGDIISQMPVAISDTDDAADLYAHVLEVAKKQVIEFTKAFAEDRVEPKKQDPTAGNAWRKRGRADGQIDWRMSARAIYNLVRGLTHPYVGAHFMKGEAEVKVWKCQVIDTN